MEKIKTPTILVIFGISGDLAKQKLLPAIKLMEEGKILPEKFKIVGITRQNNPEFYQMDVANAKDYEKLNEFLDNMEKEWGESTERLFYLSVPSQASKSIIEFIGTSSLAQNQKNKILLEKPFGNDLENAKELIEHINKYFKPEQIYRVDHYITKKAMQDFISHRQSDPSLREKWNKDSIESIVITVSETIDVKNRINFYEQTGALRDMIQSHLLELTAITLIDLPEERKSEEMPNLRYKALKQLHIVCDVNDVRCIKRGQYEGYRDEAGSKNNMKESAIETFASINLQSTDPSWVGVPIKLTTGKALKEKFTEIKIKYKTTDRNEVREQIIKIDSNPKDYARVLYNAINSDKSLFVSSNEVLETWRILDPIQDLWKNNKNDLIIYKKGSTVEEILNLV